VRLRLLQLSILAGCSNSGLGQTDVATGTTGDTGPATVALQDCGSADLSWVGTWNLSAVRCGTFEFDDWYDSHDSATMVVAQDPAGGCTVETTIVGPTCSRVENWTFTVPVGTEVEVDRKGIASCDPAACTFAPTDPPCNPGDFAGTEPHQIDDSSGALTIVGLLADTATACILDIVTTWAPSAR
jgi:hypothetical protein